MLSLLQILLSIVNIIWFVVIAHVVMSWLINFQVLNIRQPLVAQIWYALNRLLEPVYSRIRSFLPNIAGIDLAPLIFLLGVFAVQRVIQNNIPLYY